MRPANNQTHWQMSAASHLGPKPWSFICASYRISELLSDMIFMFIVFHSHLAFCLGDGMIDTLRF
jgi:hypothetical protein